MRPALRARPAAIAAMLAVATISSASASAFSDAAGPGTFSITPAVVETTLSPGSPLPPISVANSTATAFRIRVYPALVRQNLDGRIVREREEALGDRVGRPPRHILEEAKPDMRVVPPSEEPLKAASDGTNGDPEAEPGEGESA